MLQDYLLSVNYRDLDFIHSYPLVFFLYFSSCPDAIRLDKALEGDMKTSLLFCSDTHHGLGVTFGQYRTFIRCADPMAYYAFFRNLYHIVFPWFEALIRC